MRMIKNLKFKGLTLIIIFMLVLPLHGEIKVVKKDIDKDGNTDIVVNNGIIEIGISPSKGGRIFSMKYVGGANIIHPMWGFISDHPGGVTFSEFWSEYRNSEYKYLTYERKNSLFVKLVLDSERLPFKIVKIVKITENSEEIKIMHKFISQKEYKNEIESAMTGFLKIDKEQEIPYIFYVPFKEGVIPLGGKDSDEEIEIPYLCEVNMYNKIIGTNLKENKMIYYSPAEQTGFIITGEKINAYKLCSGVDPRAGYISYEFHTKEQWGKNEIKTNIYTIKIIKGSPMEEFNSIIDSYRSLVSVPMIKKEKKGVPDTLISGTFVQAWDPVSSWSREKWAQESKAMKDVGIDTIIIGASGFENQAFYPSKYLPMAGDNYIGKIISIADETGMKVYMGLYHDRTWWNAEKSRIYLKKEAVRNKKMAKEICSLFGKNKSFAGWYIPHEISDAVFRSSKKRDKLAEFYSDVSLYCKELTPGKKVGIAPYYSGSMRLTQYEKWWDGFLNKANIDIVMLQDGVGVNSEDRLAKVPLIFSAIKQACDKNNVELWDDLEIFKQIHGWPYDDQAFAAIPGDIDRIKKQINAVDNYDLVNKIVIWEFNNYMSPVRNKDNSKILYENYKSYYEKIKK